MTPNYIIPIPDGSIVIQSCDSESANVGVFVGARGSYHHITLPDCKRKWKPVYSTEFPVEEYDRVLSEQRDALLSRISELNI